MLESFFLGIQLTVCKVALGMPWKVALGMPFPRWIMDETHIHFHAVTQLSTLSYVVACLHVRASNGCVVVVVNSQKQLRIKLSTGSARINLEPCLASMQPPDS